MTRPIVKAIRKDTAQFTKKRRSLTRRQEERILKLILKVRHYREKGYYEALDLIDQGISPMSPDAFIAHLQKQVDHLKR